VAGYADDLAYDAKHHRLYIACGDNGMVTVIEQRSADDYQVIGNIPTKPGAKTGRLVPENNRYDVDVSSNSFLFKDKQEAQLVVLNVVP
jgi:hypothetical protein